MHPPISYFVILNYIFKNIEIIKKIEVGDCTKVFVLDFLPEKLLLT